MSALCYFNGNFNIFEYILPNKTCQSYSWVTLSNMICCDSTQGLLCDESLHRGANTFFSTQFKRRVTSRQTQICTCEKGLKVAVVVVAYRRANAVPFVFRICVWRWRPQFKMGIYGVVGCWFNDNPCMLSSRGVLNCDLFYSLIIH